MRALYRPREQSNIFFWLGSPFFIIDSKGVYENGMQMLLMGSTQRLSFISNNIISHRRAGNESIFLSITIFILRSQSIIQNPSKTDWKKLLPFWLSWSSTNNNCHSSTRCKKSLIFIISTSTPSSHQAFSRQSYIYHDAFLLHNVIFVNYWIHNQFYYCLERAK